MVCTPPTKPITYQINQASFWWFKPNFQLENGYTFHDYNIKLNDVIQLMVKLQPDDDDKKEISNGNKVTTEENGENKEDDKKVIYTGTSLLVK